MTVPTYVTSSGAHVDAEATFDLPVTERLDYDATGLLTYIGSAPPGSATSAAVWRIQKLSYDTSGNLIASQWAGVSGGAPGESNIWDNRTSLTYA